MKSCFKIRKPPTRRCWGFTLIETMTAVALLAFIGVSVWVIMEHCMESAADITQRMRAFEIARENMEKIRGLASVQETTDFGISELYPDIKWQTAIESFFDSQSSKMWVRAVSSAQFTDAAGKDQTVELTDWLTELTDEQAQQLLQGKEAQQQQLAQYLIESEDLAAEYAGVNLQTLREWVRNGMPMFNGAYIKPWLDFYLQYNGNPTAKQIQEFKDAHPELSTALPQQAGQTGKDQQTQQNKNDTSNQPDLNPNDEPAEEPGDNGMTPPPPPG